MVLFKYLIANEQYKDYTHVWAVNNLEADYIKEYKHLKNVKFVRIYSRDYLKAIARAKYLINNRHSLNKRRKKHENFA